MKTLFLLFLIFTMKKKVESKPIEDSVPAESHHSHHHHHDNHHHHTDHHHGDHHDGYKARILIKKVHVPVPVEKKIPVPVQKCVPVPMKVFVPYPYPVQKLVPQPYKVLIKVPTPVLQRFPVEKVIPYPVKVPFDQPVPVRVFVPYPIPVEKKVPVIVRVPIDYPIPIQKDLLDTPNNPFNNINNPFNNIEGNNLLEQQNNFENENQKVPESNGDIQQIGNDKNHYVMTKAKVSFLDNFDKSQVYQMIIRQLNEENSSGQNLDVPVEQKLVVSDHNFDTKPFYPNYLMSFESGMKSEGLPKEEDESDKIKYQSGSDHYEGFDPSSVFEKKNNEYHQHLTENFDATKLFEAPKLE